MIAAMTERHSALEPSQRLILTSLLKAGPDELHQSVGKFLTALKFPSSRGALASEIHAAEDFAESVRRALIDAAMTDPESNFSQVFTPIYGDYEEALMKGSSVVEAVGSLIEELWRASQTMLSRQNRI